MPTHDDATQMRVAVAADKRTATLMLAADFPREMLTESLCLSLIQGEGVQVTDYTQQAVRDLLATTPEPGQPTTCQIAKATPPDLGQPGRVIWTEHEKQAKPNEPSSHYDRSAFTMVTQGLILGDVIAPVPEIDGVDVCGNSLPAKPAKAVKLDLDDTVMCDSQGKLIAMIDGVLVRSGFKLRIRNLLEVSQYVDFSTGHIDFDGEVHVRKGVRDCFSVKATGDIRVDGLVEAATIECGGKLVAAGGFAGREQGSAQVGGNLEGRYLDNIKAIIGGDLIIDREVVNCDLQINGQINAPNSSFIGGKLCATGQVKVASLGSPAGVRTTLILGQVPKLELFVGKLSPILQDLTGQRDKMLAKQKLLEALGDRATPAQREEQTEIFYEVSLIQTNWLRAKHAMDAMTNSIGVKRTIDMHVSRKLHAGVCILIDGQLYEIDQDVQGPIHLWLDANGQVVYKQGQQEPVLLKHIARVKAA